MERRHRRHPDIPGVTAGEFQRTFYSQPVSLACNASSAGLASHARRLYRRTCWWSDDVRDASPRHSYSLHRPITTLHATSFSPPSLLQAVHMAHALEGDGVFWRCAGSLAAPSNWLGRDWHMRARIVCKTKTSVQLTYWVLDMLRGGCRRRGASDSRLCRQARFTTSTGRGYGHTHGETNRPGMGFVCRPALPWFTPDSLFLYE